MMYLNIKKVFAGALTAATLFTATTPGLMATVQPITADQPIAIMETEKMAYYAAVSGTITQITPHATDDSIRFVEIKGDNDSIANLVIGADTILVEGLTLAVGVKVTGFFEAGRPMILIYPPQYTTIAVAAQQDGFVHGDIFDENLVSRDGQLKLNIGQDTKVALPDGTAYTGELKGKHLLVYYTVSTRSIPAQTTPSKVIMLDSAASETETPDPGAIFVDSCLDLLVNGKPVKSPGAYVNDEGVVMVPLREVVRALGYRYKWNSSQRRGYINGELFVRPGVDVYNIRQTDAVASLGAAPEMRGIRLYVPLEFFREVLGVNNAYVLEGQVVIDNGELMR